jgi:hypothetical protein
MPPQHLINQSLKRRVGNFQKRLKDEFRKRKVRSNLHPHQREILSTLRKDNDFVVFHADKNLGPCIIERDQYIKRCLQDHLTDTTTYRALTYEDATTMIEETKRITLAFYETFNEHLSTEDYKYLIRSTTVVDPFPKFYITAKIHKSPWKSRPIVSVPGSLLHGLGRWIDKVLQPYAKQCTAFIGSSFHLKELLVNLPPLPDNARLYTADAVSMYTNIDTAHALRTIRNYLLYNCGQVNYNTIHGTMSALEIVMTNNIFQFGDTYWIQLNGTAMGTPPAVTYATLYFAPHENWLLRKYPELKFYKRYIDDIIGIWIPTNQQDDNNRWNSYIHDLNLYGSLKWDVSERSKQVDYLDLTISINNTGRITTTLFEKVHNLYLYLPPHSNHPKGMLRGLIFGSLFRIHRLTSEPEMKAEHINNFYRRLLARGHNKKYVLEAITEANRRYQNPTLLSTKKQTDDDENRIYFHISYHPMDPTSNIIQTIFRQELLHPRGLTPLQKLLNHKKAEIGINRLIVAYHRPPNLGNLLSPRLMQAEQGPTVSSYLD